MRGKLSKSTLESISEQLPDIRGLQETVIPLTPDMISMHFNTTSTIPNASVCLYDTVSALQEARYALHEAIAHKIWYLDKDNPSNELAVFFSRFYADDVTLRLYAAGEYLAEAIADMLEIAPSAIAKFEKKRVSRQSIVGNYLRKERPSHPITSVILQLADSKEWRSTIAYRDEWVHSQPPLIEGLGTLFRRGSRWKISTDGKGYKLGIELGDEPEYTIDDLLNFIRPALIKFAEAVTAVVAYYIELRKKQQEENATKDQDPKASEARSG
ncbi:hypothetical protein TFLX_05853 [Thermoflexales bacterium]|nr:hypothetical protein TFLX_05853 [Thermoflexales bacterium]